MKTPDGISQDKKTLILDQHNKFELAKDRGRDRLLGKKTYPNLFDTFDEFRQWWLSENSIEDLKKIQFCI